MQDPIGIPACFSSSSVLQKLPARPEEADYKNQIPPTINYNASSGAAAVTRSGQSLFMSVYKTKIGNQCRLITITWCKNLLLHGLSVSVQATTNATSSSATSTTPTSTSSTNQQQSHYTCKVELKPWYFWRKVGNKRFTVDGIKPIDVYWDLKSAKFHGETEPTSEYYVAVVCDSELVLLLGDLKKEAYKKTGCKPSLIQPVLVSKKEHVFGKKKFTTRAKFHERGRYHDISIEYKMNNSKHSSSSGGGGSSSKKVNGGGSGHLGRWGSGGGGMVEEEPEMEVKIDGIVAIQVKNLQWKFRGNQSIHLNRLRIDVYWDVHDWLFNPGLRHGLFIFKPVINVHPNISTCSPSSTLSSFSSPALSGSSFSSPLSSSTNKNVGGGDHHGVNNSSNSEFCLFLYAWKVE